MVSNNKTLFPEQLQSKVIDFLRFPLIVGVVFIHNYASGEVVQGIQYGIDQITVVGIALLFYKFLKCCLPRFANVIMGGR